MFTFFKSICLSYSRLLCSHSRQINTGPREHLLSFLYQKQDNYMVQIYAFKSENCQVQQYMLKPTKLRQNNERDLEFQTFC